VSVAVSGNHAYLASGILTIFYLGLPAPALNLGATSLNLVASWPAPTLAYSLQQTTNLQAPAWGDGYQAARAGGQAEPD